MRSSRVSLRRTVLLSSVALLSLFSTTALAQDSQSSNNPAPTNNPPQSSTQQTQQTQPTQPTQQTQQTQPQPQQTTTSRPTNQVSTQRQTETPPTRQITNGANGPNDLPTLTNAPLVITYAPPAVPPTVDAPFMQRSSLPEGTVFICVGAILGAFGAAILVWRGIVACLLHRSVERAALAQQSANEKATFPAPPAPFYKYTDRESSVSLAGAPAGRGTRRTNRGPIPSATPSQSNLFFSPTAPSLGGAGNRDSRFLPSGFYAAGTSSPSQGQIYAGSVTNLNLRPDSRGLGAQSRNTMRDPSPPDSPQFGPRRDMSTSSLNLNRPPSARAPSAFLDDLLDDNPHSFPPPGGMPPPPGPRHSQTYSQSSLGRYQ
jgi:hypothetical protein